MKENTPMFDSVLQKKLAQGKYTRWAVDLDEETLVFLLDVVGEYGTRTSMWNRLQEQLDAPVPKLIERKHTGFFRLILALRAIRDIHSGRERAKRAWAEDFLSGIGTKLPPDAWKESEDERARTRPKPEEQKEQHQHSSQRVSNLTRQPNPPRRSVKGGRRGRK